jgi:hypothetical protein
MLARALALGPKRLLHSAGQLDSVTVTVTGAAAAAAVLLRPARALAHCLRGATGNRPPVPPGNCSQCCSELESPGPECNTDITFQVVSHYLE